ncbi:hypothetical protein N7541_000447 [Penicillium brevicompactum]|uniref:LysM domain-containing protein n=1 Tax=Penicillium brevicompactum TaxID=5074 RepID=A0A9W9V520_PENBR|nr:hypothetical protein N7541_000447 [Penicillium brevicompactum]
MNTMNFIQIFAISLFWNHVTALSSSEGYLWGSLRKALQKRNAPVASADGICFTHTLQRGENCAILASTYSVSVADIEIWNTGSWGWKGCPEIMPGDFICVSSGGLPMPKALPDAVCGPQTPGAVRPANYVDLALVKPCLPGGCCSRWFQCGNSSAFCDPDNGCLSGCGSFAFKEVADVLKKEAHKQATLTTSVASTTSTTSKEKPTSESTTSTTKTKEPVAVSRDPPEPEAEPGIDWVITLYEEKGCEGGNYYALQGHNTDKNMECLNLQAWISTEITNDKTSCRWWTEGGLKWQKCTKSKLREPKSWYLKFGGCSVFTDPNCQVDGGHISKKGCHGPKESYWSPDEFTSFMCFNNTPWPYI